MYPGDIAKLEKQTENESCHVMHYLAILLMCRVTLFVSSLFSFLTHRTRSLRQGGKQRAEVLYFVADFPILFKYFFKLVQLQRLFYLYVA